MAKELTDDELNLRRKARRRLIGAIALTLAVVVILPMVLESQPKPTGEDIDLRIPAPDKAGDFVPTVAVSAVSAPVALAESAVVAASAVEQAASAVADAAVTPAVVNAVASKPITQPAAAQPAPDVKAAPAKTQSAAAATAKPADKATGGYAAQIGAFSNANTAKQELDKLKGWGFKAYTEKSGDKIRVRVGPYEERDKAEKVAKMLEKHGLHPSVVSSK